MYLDQTFALCADQKGLIRCKNGLKIKIMSANYGRTYDQVCPGGKTDTLTCRSKSPEIKVKWIATVMLFVIYMPPTDSLETLVQILPNILKFLIAVSTAMTMIKTVVPI